MTEISTVMNKLKAKMFYGRIEIVYVLAWYIAVIINGLEFRCIGIPPRWR